MSRLPQSHPPGDAPSASGRGQGRPSLCTLRPRPLRGRAQEPLGCAVPARTIDLYEPYNAEIVALTVGDLFRTTGLDIKPVAGNGGLSHPIRWVHVSELADPTRWLKGGELLLTTGMGVGKAQSQQRAYVRRLVRAGLAGLGFGTGFSFRSVPKAVIAASEEAAFPVFEVPYAVPFIAITELVFTRLVAEQYDLLSRSLDVEHNLTRGVLDGAGIVGVVSGLARAVGGWAVLFDLHGSRLAAEPGASEVYIPRLWSEVQPRAESSRFSLSMVDRGQHIVIQPVTAQGRVEAFLGVGKRDALSQFDRIVSSHAMALLALELDKARAVSETERRLKGDLLDKIVAGEVEPGAAREALERLGFDLREPVVAVAIRGDQPVQKLAVESEQSLARVAARGAFVVGPRDEMVLAILQPREAGFLPDLRSDVVTRSMGEVLVGAGSSGPLEHLLQSVREARYALQVCRTEGRLHAAFEDLGSYQLLLSLQDPEALRTFADSVLAPLDRYDRAHSGELVSSLRAFLDRNARWEWAAKDLLVHRHTLRYRMRKVEELTGRELSSARDRMEFFLALRARDLLEEGGTAQGTGRDPPSARAPYLSMRATTRRPSGRARA
jgi:purine catabolism regulator